MPRFVLSKAQGLAPMPRSVYCVGTCVGFCAQVSFLVSVPRSGRWLLCPGRGLTSVPSSGLGFCAQLRAWLLYPGQTESGPWLLCPEHSPRRSASMPRFLLGFCAQVSVSASVPSSGRRCTSVPRVVPSGLTSMPRFVVGSCAQVRALASVPSSELGFSAQVCAWLLCPA